MRLDPKLIVQTLQKNKAKVRMTARELRIAPSTVSFWKRRARSVRSRMALSTKGLARKSTAPKTPRKGVLTSEEKIAIEQHRLTKGQCAIKVKAELKIPHSVDTIHRFLDLKGLIEKDGYHRRPRYQPTTHMHAKNATAPGKLQMDVKYVTPQLSGLPHTLFLYAIADIYSRYKQGVILPALDQALAIEAAALLVPQFPFACDFIQTDNGLEFQERFDQFVQKELGLKHHYIHKSSPNENAIIERSFRTDEEEFFFFRMTKPKDEMDLNAQYQDWMQYFNNERLHIGIDLMTPAKKAKN
jgi:transposase InsO family protein